MPEMKYVLSSHVMEIGYDADKQELWVRFAPTVKDPRGPLGYYQGVDPETAENIISSPSIGSALNAQVKPYYQWQAS